MARSAFASRLIQFIVSQVLHYCKQKHISNADAREATAAWFPYFRVMSVFLGTWPPRWQPKLLVDEITIRVA